MKFLLSLIVAAFALVASTNAHAQFAVGKRVGHIDYAHSTVGTSAALAIAAASVGGNSVKFMVCNDAVNTSTFLEVSSGADPATDGIRLGLGQCFVCENCSNALLKALNVKAQAASNGYSVIQYRE